ncbi:MAG: thioredoxin domain-containing protein [Ferruginibacter sp.]
MSSVLRTAVNSNDHFQGDLSAPIVLLEYGDYQCPHCRNAFGIIKKIQSEFGPELTYVFRHFPLTEVHFYARQAAIAVEAAGLQDKYWEMHDTIYENQEKLSTSGLTSFAKKIGLDMSKFKSDLKSETIEKKVDDDFEGGVRSGVNFTPCFFINGVRFEGGAQDLYNSLQQKKS